VSRLPFATAEELTLPGTRGYRVMEDTLARRLESAEQRMRHLESRDIVPPSVMEAAVAELDAAHRAIDDYEAEQRELDEERSADSRLTIAEELR